MILTIDAGEFPVRFDPRGQRTPPHRTGGGRFSSYYPVYVRNFPTLYQAISYIHFILILTSI